MTNLPTNPTKNQIIEENWFGFLRYVNEQHLKRQKGIVDLYDTGQAVLEYVHSRGYEHAFWYWYQKTKMEQSDAN